MRLEFPNCPLVGIAFGGVVSVLLWVLILAGFTGASVGIGYGLNWLFG